jgi:hypothetical protein
MIKSGGIGEFVAIQANAGEDRGQERAMVKTQQIEIHKVWQTVDEDIENSPSVLSNGSLSLHPPKPFEGAGE